MCLTHDADADSMCVNVSDCVCVWGGVADVPTKVSSSMAQNLSVPIMFVCLLHLANEKHLKISSTEAMDELMVVQG